MDFKEKRKNTFYNFYKDKKSMKCAPFLAAVVDSTITQVHFGKCVPSESIKTEFHL